MITDCLPFFVGICLGANILILLFILGVRNRLNYHEEIMQKFCEFIVTFTECMEKSKKNKE